jgi:hypothetical protein
LDDADGALRRWVPAQQAITVRHSASASYKDVRDRSGTVALTGLGG